jgi:hypothetical protein
MVLVLVLGGLIVITLQPSTVARWALSLHTCSKLLDDLVAMKDGVKLKVTEKHKEETAARVQI